ncbi:hypothetical protein [Erythrobacter colymbi]|uniref:hypothetical protein n=1 Tax=Erythrobacter colymbi TaxID=1161202 RepID=UPI00117E4481|nr:hypothetical protein [Erythrobacter colymbi]
MQHRLLCLIHTRLPAAIFRWLGQLPYPKACLIIDPAKADTRPLAARQTNGNRVGQSGSRSSRKDVRGPLFAPRLWSIRQYGLILRQFPSHCDG